MERLILRLKKFIHHKGFSNNKFAELTGLSSAQISQMLSGNRSFGIDKLLKIFTAFPDLNAEWLFKGYGEMIIDPSEKDKTLPNKDLSNLLINSFDRYDSIKLVNLLSNNDIPPQVKKEIEAIYANAAKIKTFFLKSLYKQEGVATPIFESWEIKSLLDNLIEVYNRYIWLSDIEIQKQIEFEDSPIDMKIFFNENTDLYSNYINFSKSFKTLEGRIIDCLSNFSQYDPHGIVHPIYKKITKKK